MHQRWCTSGDAPEVMHHVNKRDIGTLPPGSSVFPIYSEFFLFLQVFIGFHVWVQSRHKRFVYRKRYSSAPDPDIFLFLRNIVSFYVFGQDFCFSAICIFNLNLMHSSPRIGKSSHKGRNKFLLQKFLVCRRRPLFCTGYKKWSFVRVLWEWSFSDSPEIFQIPSARFADRPFANYIWKESQVISKVFHSLQHDSWVSKAAVNTIWEVPERYNFPQNILTWVGFTFLEIILSYILITSYYEKYTAYNFGWRLGGSNVNGWMENASSPDVPLWT